MTAAILSAILLALNYPVQSGPAPVACHLDTTYVYNWTTHQLDYAEGYKQRCRIYRPAMKRGL